MVCVCVRVCLSRNTDLVLQTEMQVRKHVQTWRQQRHLYRHDAQLALLCLPRISTDTDDVTTAQFVVDVNEVFLRFVIPEWRKGRMLCIH